MWVGPSTRAYIFFSRSRSRTCSLHFQNGPWCLTKPTVYLTRPLFRSFRRLCFASRHSLTIAIDIECVSPVVDQSFWIINLDVDESSYTDEVITCSEHELTHWHVCAEWVHSDHFVTQLSSSNCCCFGRVAMCNMSCCCRCSVLCRLVCWTHCKMVEPVDVPHGMSELGWPQGTTYYIGPVSLTRRHFGDILGHARACWRSVDILDVIHLITKLDAGQSPTLARPAAPLASFGQRISSVDKANKNWLSWQGPSSDRKTNFRLVICIRSSNNPENDRSSRFWDNWHESLKINKKHSAARQAKQADSSEWIFSVDGARCRPVIMCAWMGRLNMLGVNVQHVNMYDMQCAGRVNRQTSWSYWNLPVRLVLTAQLDLVASTEQFRPTVGVHFITAPHAAESCIFKCLVVISRPVFSAPPRVCGVGNCCDARWCRCCCCWQTNTDLSVLCSLCRQFSLVARRPS